MSGKAFVTICSLLLVQLALARVARDAPAAPTEPFAELLIKAKELQNAFFDVVGVKDQQELDKKIETEAKKYAEKLGNIATELKKTTDENIDKIGESDAFKNLKVRVDEAVNNLKKENPEASKNVEQLTKTTKSLIEGISNLGDSESAKQIKDLGSQILQTTVDALKDVKNKIEESNKSE